MMMEKECGVIDATFPSIWKPATDEKGWKG